MKKEDYKSFLNEIDEGFCIIEVLFDNEMKAVDYIFLEVNKAFEGQTGLYDAIGKRMRELAPLHEEHWFEIYGRVAETGKPARFMNHAKQLNRYYNVFAYRVGHSKEKKVAILFNDISGRIQAEKELIESEKQLKKALNEKELLLKEVYHRAKNDLQMVASLLNLQAGKVMDEKYKHAFNDMNNRIQSMALVHKRLYDTQSLTEINLGNYIKDLMQLLKRSHANEKIRIEVNVVDYEVPAVKAVPCGLIVTELVLNAFKYAFPGEAEGILKVILKKDVDNKAVLIVKDNGIGIKQEQLYKEENLGTSIVRTLAEDQLQGKIELKRNLSIKMRQKIIKIKLHVLSLQVYLSRLHYPVISLSAFR